MCLKTLHTSQINWCRMTENRQVNSICDNCVCVNARVCECMSVYMCVWDTMCMWRAYVRLHVWLCACSVVTGGCWWHDKLILSCQHSIVGRSFVTVTVNHLGSLISAKWKLAKPYTFSRPLRFEDFLHSTPIKIFNHYRRVQSMSLQKFGLISMVLILYLLK